MKKKFLKKSKICSFVIIFFSFLFLSWSSSEKNLTSKLFSEEDTDELKQISGSLTFHVHEWISYLESNQENLDDFIIFSPEEVNSLWIRLNQKMEKQSKNITLFQNALEYYHTGITMVEQGSIVLGLDLLKKSYDSIYVLWLNLNKVNSLIPIIKSPNCYSNFDNNPHISNGARNKIKPFLVPITHPIKPNLDSIFSSSRATFNKNTLISAGFLIKFIQPRSFIIVASHPILSGYLLKLYVDTELKEKGGKPGWSWFVKRCIGAKEIKKIIARKKNKVL
jgi:hypothetical protein